MDNRRRMKIAKTNDIFSTVVSDDGKAIRSVVESNVASLKDRSDEGWTSLHVAVILSKELCVDVLLEHGADIVAKDVEGKTPLHWAAFRNVKLSIFEKLALSQGQVLDTDDIYGRTPLHYICMNQSTDKEENEENIHELVLKLELMLRLMKSIDSVDYEGNTPLMLLCKHIHNFAETEEISRNLLPDNLKTFKSKSVCGFTLEMFLKCQVEPLKQNEYGISALHSASLSNCVEMINLLLPQYKSATPPLDANGHTPMSFAFHCNIQCVSLQYTHAQCKWYPLSIFKTRFEDCLRPILKNMKDVVNNDRAIFGSTVLHYAMLDTKSSSNVVKGLIGYGRACVNAKNFAGKTPIFYGIEKYDMVVPHSLYEVLRQNRKEKIQLLIQNGTEINVVDHAGCSPLHLAAGWGDVDLIEILLENNANVNHCNKIGATPLQYLCFSSKDFSIINSAMELLISSGADMNIQDLYGSSILHYALYTNATRLFKDLIERGADARLTDLNGNNPDSYFEKLKQKGILNVLEDETLDNDCYMMPIHVQNVNDWLLSNISSKNISDEKIRDLLKSSNTNRLSNSLSDNVVLKKFFDLMKVIFDKVEEIDPRLKVTFELSGSTREGTKVECQDEFDLLCFLDNFEQVCDVNESVDSGFVECRLREGDDFLSYRSFFDEENVLMANRLTTALFFCIRKAMSDPSTWESGHGFIEDDDELRDFGLKTNLMGIKCLKFFYTDEWYKSLPVSCDIVPAIRKRNWQPSLLRKDGGLVTKEAMEKGFLIIAKPFKDKSLSGEAINKLTYFKTSVYLAECAVLESLPPHIIEAYKLAKIILKQKNLYPGLFDESEDELLYGRTDDDSPPSKYDFHPANPTMSGKLITSYMLKNALFYELDSEVGNLESSTNISDIRIWTSRIFRRLRSFFEKGKFPPYFLPIGSLVPPVEGSLNSLCGSHCKIISSLFDGTIEDEIYLRS